MKWKFWNCINYKMSTKLIYTICTKGSKTVTAETELTTYTCAYY